MYLRSLQALPTLPVPQPRLSVSSSTLLPRARLILSPNTETAVTDQLPHSEAVLSTPDMRPGQLELDMKLTGREEGE